MVFFLGSDEISFLKHRLSNGTIFEMVNIANCLALFNRSLFTVHSDDDHFSFGVKYFVIWVILSFSNSKKFSIHYSHDISDMLYQFGWTSKVIVLKLLYFSLYERCHVPFSEFGENFL